MLRDVRHLLYTAAYYPREIARILDKRLPSFVAFDPVLGYVLKDYIFRDGQGGILCDYIYEKRGGHRLMVNYRHLPCRLNAYGDSYTQCAQVSCGETWQEILAAHFREPIRNFGVGGYVVYQASRRLLRTEARKDLCGRIPHSQHLGRRPLSQSRRRALDPRRLDVPRSPARRRKNSYPVHGFPWIDCLRHAAEEYKFFKLPLEKWLSRYYLSRAGAQVFGHYSPAGNFWFAHTIRPYLVDWLDPKPPAYR
ncbi:MAG: hypothetical protein N3A66_01180 [Planctomycetota bacterium]|nr:hypothetical protein [Planctomycetota bacterium]